MVVNPSDLYIVFSRTNTGIGRIIRTFTHNTYNHTSLCLGGELHQLISFARKHKNDPFHAGVVVETPVRYISFGEDVVVKVCRIDQNLFPLEDMKKRLEKVRSSVGKKYIYNTYGAMVSPFKIKFSPYHTFTCVEFTAYILGVKEKIYSVRQLENIFDGQKVYEGSYKKLMEDYQYHYPNDDYYERQPKKDIIFGTCHHFYENALRSFYHGED